jgi:hypothetical protein
MTTFDLLMPSIEPGYFLIERQNNSFSAQLCGINMPMFNTSPFKRVAHMDAALSVTNDSRITKFAFSIIHDALKPLY